MKDIFVAMSNREDFILRANGEDICTRIINIVHQKGPNGRSFIITFAEAFTFASEKQAEPQACDCAQWAKKASSPTFGSCAITFSCPEHGVVTIDKRPMIQRGDATRVIPPSSNPNGGTQKNHDEA